MKLLLVLCALLLLGVQGKTLSRVVTTKSGPVQGYINDEVQIFRGIPFAAPPVGDKRFLPPTLVEPWTKTKECLFVPHMCPQIRLSNSIFLGHEDCLYLNVYTPPDASPGDKLPVFVWFFGGGWVAGDSTEFGLYDATNIVKKHGYILVSVNYRVCSLGFLTLDALRDEDPLNRTGNMALYDQRQGLQWVQDNIVNFGGDPNRVTIFGESAGAFSVCFHLASQKSAGLFQAALMESGSCDSRMFYAPYEKQRAWSRTWAKLVGCDIDKLGGSAEVLGCLRKLTTGQVIGGEILSPPPANVSMAPEDQKQGPLGFLDPQLAKLFPRRTSEDYYPLLYPAMPWAATIDGTEFGLTDRPRVVVQRGDSTPVDIVLGTNQDEGSIFVPLVTMILDVGFPLDGKGLDTVLMHFFEQNTTTVATVRELYPIDDYSSYDKLAAAVLRDFFFVCSSRRMSRAMTDQNRKAYLYHNAYKGDWIEDPFLGVYHSAELEFVFDNAWPPIIHAFSERDTKMASIFGQFWSNFAWFGTPNGDPLDPPPMNWPAWNASTQLNILLALPPQVERNYRDGVCNFFDKLKL